MLTLRGRQQLENARRLERWNFITREWHLPDVGDGVGGRGREGFRTRATIDCLHRVVCFASTLLLSFLVAGNYNETFLVTLITIFCLCHWLRESDSWNLLTLEMIEQSHVWVFMLKH
jgi:hypothetical protein